MRKIWKMAVLAGLSLFLLSGCNMLTVDQMYCLPKRSEEYTNLQSQIDESMSGLEYSAPLSGENQQTVQQADIDGDGQEEYLLFAKGTSEKPLRIFIYAENQGSYYLMDTIECNGSAFEQVEYVQMTGNDGLEIVVGRQVSDQVLRSLSVYTMVDGQMEQVMTANYSKFVCTDLDKDCLAELLLLRPGVDNTESSVAELYSLDDNNAERSYEVLMSGSTEKIKRIMVGKLNDGRKAVFVASEVDSSSLVTDVFAVVDGQLTNVALSNESGTDVQTLRNYYVYAEDIDGDGVLELPSLIPVDLASDSGESQHIIRWYALKSDGSEVDKMYTYHNYVGGWYLKLSSRIAERISVTQTGNSYEFYVWSEDFTSSERLLTLYVLTGQRREEQAVTDNRFVLYRSDTTIYAANLEVASAAYNITKEDILDGFRLIVQEWYTGMT